MFIDRKPRKATPWLAFKVGAFTAGAVLALAGIYFQSDWMIWAAIGVLFLGFGVRFLPHPDSGEPPADEDDEAFRKGG